MFEAYYQSVWQHPILLWVVPVVFLGWLFLRVGRPQTFLAGYAYAICAETILDPLMTGSVLAWGQFSGAVSHAIMITFVIMGDWRVFVLTQCTVQPKRVRVWGQALALAFIVPILQAVAIAVFPNAFEQSRHTFLLYEVLFFLLAAGMRFWVLPRRALPANVRTWLQGVMFYVMTYYALWAMADVVILAGHDWGFGLRVVPNLLYYGAFIPFVYLTAPRELRS